MDNIYDCTKAYSIDTYLKIYYQEKLDELEQLFPFIHEYRRLHLENYILNRIEELLFKKYTLQNKYDSLKRFDNNIYSITTEDLETLLLNLDCKDNDSRTVYSKDELAYLEDLYDSTLCGPLILGRSEFLPFYEKLSTHKLPNELNHALFSYFLGEYLDFLEELRRRTECPDNKLDISPDDIEETCEGQTVYLRLQPEGTLIMAEILVVITRHDKRFAVLSAPNGKGDYDIYATKVIKDEEGYDKLIEIADETDKALMKKFVDQLVNASLPQAIHNTSDSKI